MLRLLRLLAVLFTRLFRSRRNLLLENLALRQQLSVFKRKRPQPRLALTDKFFWVVLRRLWPGWKWALILVQPETAMRSIRRPICLTPVTDDDYDESAEQVVQRK
jgi:hypothetical protein